METMKLKKLEILKRLIFTFLGIATFLSAQAQKEEFGMSDGPVDTSFKPVYSYLILGGVFIFAVVIYLLFKRFEKPKKKTNYTASTRPMHRAGGSVKRR